MPTALQTEQDWAHDHPVPESTVQDMLLSLWNYPVATSDLAPEHRAALDRFLGVALLGGSAHPSKTEVYLTGHASDTGDDDANMTLSRQRAQNVARYLLGRGVPQQQMRVDWVGASDPVDRGDSGLAAARNRRIDLLKFTPSEPEPRRPVDVIDQPQPQPPPPPGHVPAFKLPPPQMSKITIEDTVTVWKSERFTSAWVICYGQIDVVLKLSCSDDGDGFAAGVKMKSSGEFGIKAEGEIASHIKSKFSIDVNSDKSAVNVKLGAELSAYPLKPEVGIQAKLPELFYATFTVPEMPISEFEAGGLHFHGTMSVKGTVNFLPGPAALAVASPIIVTLLILSLTVEGIRVAESEQTRYAALLAAREGIAAGIARELAGTGAEPAFKARQLDWHKANLAMEVNFVEGAKKVDQILGASPEARNAWDSEWKKKYAADNAADFQTLFSRVFDNVGGTEADGSLDDSVARAVAE